MYIFLFNKIMNETSCLLVLIHISFDIFTLHSVLMNTLKFTKYMPETLTFEKA